MVSPDRTASLRTLSWILLLLFASFSAYFGVSAKRESIYLHDLAKSIVASKSSDRERAIALARWVHESVPKVEAGSFPRPPLRLGPREIIENGGQCGEFVRVLVTLMREAGIPAHRVYLYNQPDFADSPASLPFNVNAEVLVDGRWVILDAYYFLYFSLSDGRLATREDLAKDRSLLVQSRVPLKPTSYLYVSGVNWSRPAWIAPYLYRVLRVLLGERVDRLAIPVILERPKILKAGLFASLAVVIGLALFFTRRGTQDMCP